MNDRWSRQNGRRWSGRERDRVSERFRSHVRTPSNPKGRIHRERCLVPTCASIRIEAHHPDYERPFLVVWCCFKHHRQIDHGSLKLKKSDFWDYTSLILQKPGLLGNKCSVKDSKLPAFVEEQETPDVPF